MASPTHQTLILGGGFAGLFAALHLSHQHYPRSVILIDQNERFCFKPLLYEYFSGEMEPNQVVPRYQDLLSRSGIIFVQDSVQSIDLHQNQVQLAGGDCYSYSNLVLSLGSVTSYLGVKGAETHALPFRTQADAIAIDRHLRATLQRAVQLEDSEQRRQLLTTAIVGAGPSGVEMAATLADLLPQWYAAMGGQPHEVRVVLINHGQEILEGDINARLRNTALRALNQRAASVELVLEAKVTAIRPDSIEYERQQQSKTLRAGTTIWTAGTRCHPLIQSLPIPDEHRDHQGRLQVTSTLQLPDFPDVFVGGDCAVDLQVGRSEHASATEPATEPAPKTDSTHGDRPTNSKPLPSTAQVAYQQGYAIASNLRALALGFDLKPAQVNLRGTLLKLGLTDGVANLFNQVEVEGKLGHLIRQGTYLELLPTPIHDFQATTEWLRDEIFRREGSVNPVKVAEVVGGLVVSALIARKLLQALGDTSSNLQK